MLQKLDVGLEDVKEPSDELTKLVLDKNLEMDEDKCHSYINDHYYNGEIFSIKWVLDSIKAGKLEDREQYLLKFGEGAEEYFFLSTSK